MRLTRRRMKARISSSLSSASVTTRFRSAEGGMSTTSPLPLNRPVASARRPESMAVSPVKFPAWCRTMRLSPSPSGRTMSSSPLRRT